MRQGGPVLPKMEKRFIALVVVLVGETLLVGALVAVDESGYLENRRVEPERKALGGGANNWWRV